MLSLPDSNHRLFAVRDAVTSSRPFEVVWWKVKL